MTNSEYSFIDRTVRVFQTKIQGDDTDDNCGTFALALLSILKDNHIPEERLSLDIFSNGTGENEEELLSNISKIYHVMLQVDDMYIDKNGVTENLDDTLTWIYEKYRDYSPAMFSFDHEDIVNKKIPAFIKNNTNYTKDVSEFLYMYQKGNKNYGRNH